MFNLRWKYHHIKLLFINLGIFWNESLIVEIEASIIQYSLFNDTQLTIYTLGLTKPNRIPDFSKNSFRNLCSMAVEFHSRVNPVNVSERGLPSEADEFTPNVRTGPLPVITQPPRFRPSQAHIIEWRARPMGPTGDWEPLSHPPQFPLLNHNWAFYPLPRFCG